MVDSTMTMGSLSLGNVKNSCFDYYDKFKKKISTYEEKIPQNVKTKLIDFGNYSCSKAKEGAKELGKYTARQLEKGAKNALPYTMNTLNNARYYNPRMRYNWWKTWQPGRCTDFRNDGKISLTEKGVEFGKGLAYIPQKAVESVPKLADYGLSFINRAIQNPLGTLIGTAVIGAVVVNTGGIMLPAAAAIAAIYGGSKFVKGVNNSIKGRTDTQIKEAYRDMGSGVATTGVACLCADSALSIAKSAGLKDMKKNVDKSMPSIVNCFKCTPKSVSQSAQKMFRLSKTTYKSTRFTLKSGVFCTKVLGYGGRIAGCVLKPVFWTVKLPFKPIAWVCKKFV